MVHLKQEFSLPGNDEFWVEEVEADGKEWICLASHGVKHSSFFYFWSKAANAEAMPVEEVIAEIARRLRDLHDESDNHILKDRVKFKTPGWDQWSFGTPGVLTDYLYGPASKPPTGTAA